MTWPAPEYFAPGDAELDLASLILTDGLSSRLNKVARLRQAALHGRAARSRTRAEIAGLRSSSSPPRARARRSPRSSGSSRTRSRAWRRTGRPPAELDRAKTKQRVQLRHRPRADRRLRRQGRPPQPVQHLPRRPRQVRRGRRALRRKSRVADVRQTVRRWLEHAQPPARPLPPGDVGPRRRPRRSTARRSRRSAADRPFQRARSADREARERPGGLRRRARATCPRWR